MVVVLKCGICMEVITKRDEVFRNARCNWHALEGHGVFCVACVSGHVAARVREDPERVTCPDPRCRAYLDPQSSQQMATRLSEEVVLRWEIGTLAHIVRRLQINSCPFIDCRATLPLSQGNIETTVGVGLRRLKVECNECGRELCDRCLVPWHVGVTCKQYRKNMEKQRLKRIREGGDMDRKFKGLVKSMRWRRCPCCRLFIQKDFGCEHIQCRCRHEFCYKCGREWDFGHRCPFIYWRIWLRRYRYRTRKLLASFCQCIT